MIVTSKELFKAAKKHNFAFPTPNYVDQISVSAHVTTAEKLGLPVILAFTEVHQTYLPFNEATVTGRFHAEKAKVLVVLHLNHGQTKETIFRVIDQRFRSVTINVSLQLFEENMRRTREIVAYVHLRGAVMKAEVGHVGGRDEYKDAVNCGSIYTAVEEAKRFADPTEMGFLTIPTGTAYGTYRKTPMIDFERLAEIRNAAHTPLVLHGGSSPNDENLRWCAGGRISKVNIYTDLIAAAFNHTRECHTNRYYDLRDAQRQGMMKCLEHYYNVFSAERYLEALKWEEE